MPQMASRRASGRRILVVSASTGNGHVSAACALEQALCEADFDVVSVDALDYAPRAFQAWYRGGYELLVRHCPQIWGEIYKHSDRTNIPFRIQAHVDNLMMHRFERLVKRFKPEWVICTHSLPQPRLSRMRDRFASFRMGVVITDYYPHAVWMRGEPDFYFVPGDWTRDIILSRSPHLTEKIHITGIPIDSNFVPNSRATESRSHLRHELGLHPDIPAILLTAGGIGGGPLLNVALHLSTLTYPVQIIVVCGRNRATLRLFHEQHDSLMSNSNVHFKIEGHVPIERMAALMNASDILVSKPGGVTTAESLASGCPMVIYTPLMIPGQEEDNAHLLQQTGAGEVARTPEELLDLVKQLLNSPNILEHMRANTRELARPNAGPKIAELLKVL